MKPLHIGLLLAAGAIGGALVMNVARKPRPAPPAPVVTQAVPAVPPATAPPEAAVAQTAAPAAESAKPSPVEPPQAVRSPKHRSTARVPANPQYHASVRMPDRPAEPEPLPIPPLTPAPVAPEQSAPVSQAVPPARTEPENVTPAPPPLAPAEPHRVTLNAGTMIPVRLVDGLSSERNLPGDTFTATLDKELVVEGFVIAERGARVDGRVVSTDKGGRVKGVSALAVELLLLSTSDGQKVPLQTDGFERRAEESRRQDAGKIGAGAAIGAVIGAIAGGGKGAAIGAGVGGGAGAGAVMATRGSAATLPSETRVTFRLKAPVTITERLRG